MICVTSELNLNCDGWPDSSLLLSETPLGDSSGREVLFEICVNAETLENCSLSGFSLETDETEIKSAVCPAECKSDVFQKSLHVGLDENVDSAAE